MIAAILNNPSCYEYVASDMRPHFFFQPENEAIASIIQEHYDASFQVPSWEYVQDELRSAKWLDATEVQLHLAFLKAAPSLCPCCLESRILWFTVERTAFRGLHDAFTTMADQEVSPRDTIQFIFEACDLPGLESNRHLGMVQLAMLIPFLKDELPEHTRNAWRGYLEEPSELTIKILWKLVRHHVTARPTGLIGCDPGQANIPGVSMDDTELAVQALQRAGLVELRLGNRNSLEEERRVLRPTAKAIMGLIATAGQRPTGKALSSSESTREAGND